jgi:hypothetical protein
LNSSPDAAEAWDLKGHKLKVKPMFTYNDKTWKQKDKQKKTAGN